MTDAARCRKNGWKVGDLLIGREGGTNWSRTDTLKITAIGETHVLAKVVAEEITGDAIPQKMHYEHLWCLELRRWRKVVG